MVVVVVVVVVVIVVMVVVVVVVVFVVVVMAAVVVVVVVVAVAVGVVVAVKLWVRHPSLSPTSAGSVPLALACGSQLTWDFCHNAGPLERSYGAVRVGHIVTPNPLWRM